MVRLGQFGLHADLKQIGCVQQAAGLVGDGLGDRRVCVAQAADGDAGQPFEVGLSRGVVYSGAPSMRKLDVLTEVGVHH